MEKERFVETGSGSFYGERTSAKDLTSVADDMTGAQAQLLSAAQISLWSRIRDLRMAHFGSLSQRSINGIREEAQDLGRFLGFPNVDVQIS